MRQHPHPIVSTSIALVGALLLGHGAIGASPSPSSSPGAAPTAGAAPEAPHWSYEGEAGPEHWGDLDPGWSQCALGQAQAPIDLSGAAPADLVDPVFDWVAGPATLVDTGHSIMAVPAAGGSTRVEGRTATLSQLHFHAPGEHTVAGVAAPVEAHFVHQAEDGSLIVLGLMLTEGTQVSDPWQPYAAGLEAAAMGEQQIVLDWPALLPPGTRTIRYPGSLTTPPCSEGVEWLVLVDPVPVAPAQLSLFTSAYEGNNRPVQPLHDREVVVDTSGG